MRNKIISILFCMMLGIGSIAHIVTPDRYYSESEKRTLARQPLFSTGKLFSGEYGKELEKYLADQFPRRDDWVTLKTFVQLGIGTRKVNGVYFSKDGYLISAFDEYNEKQFKKNVTVLDSFADKLDKMNIKLRILLVPTAAEILADKLPHFAPSISQEKLVRYVADSGINAEELVDAVRVLSEHKGEYIYYKTDHHYTSLGAYYCYVAWKNSKDEQAEPITAWTSEILCDDFRGTNYSKVNFPFAAYDAITAYYKQDRHIVEYNGGDYVTDSIYERKYLDGKDKYAVFLNSNQAATVVHGNGDGRLLIIKDSYANTFAQFVVDEYEQTHIIDMRFYRKSISEYIEQNGITEVLILYNIPNFAEDMSFYPY